MTTTASIFILIVLFTCYGYSLVMKNLYERHLAFLKAELYRQQIINQISYHTDFGSQEWYDYLMAAYEPSVKELSNIAYKNKNELFKAFPESIQFITAEVKPL